MKAKRRVMATAVIGIAAAGMIGFGAHTAMADPTSSSTENVTSDTCSAYLYNARHFSDRAEELRAEGDWTGARWASKKSERYYEKYYASCYF